MVTHCAMLWFRVLTSSWSLQRDIHENVWFFLSQKLNVIYDWFTLSQWHYTSEQISQVFPLLWHQNYSNRPCRCRYSTLFILGSISSRNLKKSLEICFDVLLPSFYSLDEKKGLAVGKTYRNDKACRLFTLLKPNENSWPKWFNKPNFAWLWLMVQLMVPWRRRRWLMFGSARRGR